MSYSDLLQLEGVNSQYLVVIKPRRVADSSSWVNLSGNIYYQSFSFGEVVAVKNGASGLTEGSSTSLSNGQWYYDVDASRLYVNIGTNPSGSQIIATYELYLGTFDAHWYQNPTDDSTRVVYYEPLITRSPEVSNSTSDVIFGFLPTFSGSIVVSNVTNFLTEHVYSSSFNNCDFLIYHQLGDLNTDNIKLVLKGYCKNVAITDSSISFSILDATSFFEKEYRNPVGQNFYAQSMFSNLDPAYQGRPVRQVFGRVDGFIPVNIDYVADNDSATNTDNKRYIFMSGSADKGTISTTVLASPSSTSTRTYLTSVSGFNVGDTFWNKTATTKYGEITAIGANYIDHTSITANSSADVIERSFVGAIYVSRNETVSKLWYGRDYIEYTDGTNDVIGVDLNTTLFPTALTGDIIYANDLIYATVYGHKFSDTLSGSPFGSNSATTGNKTNPAVILYHLLKTCLGLSEAEINLTSFTALEASRTDQIGFALPYTASKDFPTYKEIILKICQTSLLKFFIDFDGKWKVSETGPVGTVTKTIEDDEIIAGSFSYSISYQDIISLALVEYGLREVSEIGISGEISSTVSATSNTALNLHQVDKQMTIQSVHFIEADAQKLADRLIYILGDRRGICKLDTKNRFFDTELDDVIEISRDRMPGFAFEAGELRSRSFAVSATSKSLSKIEIEIDDQIGIENNEGDW